MEEEKKISIPLLVGGLVLVIIIGAGGIFVAISQTPKDVVDNTISSTPPSTTPTSTPPQTTTSYKNGSYTAEGAYISPEGHEQIKVQVTLTNDVISSVTVIPEATISDSLRYQTKFANGISSFVVGKKIDAISVSRVNGSSLTSTGFNAAIEKIKTQAQE
ncbi:MAG: calcium-binding protein [Candidatus Dojkabacteria bacterium]